MSLAQEQKKEAKKPEEVRIRFDRPWRGHDVVLLSQDERDGELYAKETTLIETSTYFKELLTSANRKPEDHQFRVDCDYGILVRILQYTHQPQLRCWLNVRELLDVYNAAERFGFDSMKEHCRKQLLDWPSFSSARCALKLDLHDVLMEVIERMKLDALLKFVDSKDEKKVFSKNEALLVYEKIYGHPLPEEPTRPQETPMQMEDMMLAIPSPRIDLTKKWHASDLAILTKKAKGRLLYVSKGLLACYSEKLHKKLFSDNVIKKTSDDSDIPTIVIDFEYTPMFLIFSLLHHCDQNFCDDRFTPVDPIVLYNMYLAAVEFDLPLIKKFVTDQLYQQASIDCFHVALKLKLPRVPLLLIQRTKRSALREWIFTKEKDLIYKGDDDEIIDLSSSSAEPLLSLEELRKLTIKL